MDKHSAHLLLISPSLLMAYLASRTPSDMQLTLGLWRSILISLSSAPSMVYGALPALLDAVEKGHAQGREGKGDGWVAEMHPEEREFDEVLMTLFGDATSGGSAGKSREAVGLLERIIRSSSTYFFCAFTSIFGGHLSRLFFFLYIRTLRHTLFLRNFVSTPRRFLHSAVNLVTRCRHHPVRFYHCLFR